MILRLAILALGVFLHLQSCAVTEIDSLTLKNSWEPYHLTGDTRIRELRMEGGRMILNGHTLEVDDLIATHAGSPAFQQGKIVVRKSAIITRMTLGSLEEFGILEGAVATFGKSGEYHSPGEIFGSVTLRNDGEIHIYGTVNLGFSVTGNGKMELHDDAILSFASGASLGEVAGSGTITFSDSVWSGTLHAISGPVSAGIEIRVVRSTLSLSQNVAAISSLTISAGSTITGDGLLDIDALSVFGGKIQGIDTIRVGSSYVLEAGSHSFESEAAITVKNPSPLEFTGEIVQQEESTWSCDVGKHWRLIWSPSGPEKSPPIPLQLSTGGSTTYPVSIEMEWGAYLNDSQSSLRKSVVPGQPISLTAGIIPACFEGGGDITVRITAIPLIEGVNPAILELRGRVVPVPLISTRQPALPRGPYDLRNGNVDYTFGLEVNQSESSEAQVLVSAGGQYGPVFVPEQSFLASVGQTRIAEMHFRYASADLPDAGFDDVNLRIPVMIDIVPPYGMERPEGYPIQLDVYVNRLVYGQPRSIEMYSGAIYTSFVVVPGVRYIVEQSSNLEDWSTIQEFTANAHDFVYLDAPSFVQTQVLRFIRVRTVN